MARGESGAEISQRHCALRQSRLPRLGRIAYLRLALGRDHNVVKMVQKSVGGFPRQSPPEHHEQSLIAAFVKCGKDIGTTVLKARGFLALRDAGCKGRGFRVDNLCHCFAYMFAVFSFDSCTGKMPAGGLMRPSPEQVFDNPATAYQPRASCVLGVYPGSDPNCGPHSHRTVDRTVTARSNRVSV